MGQKWRARPTPDPRQSISDKSRKPGSPAAPGHPEAFIEAFANIYADFTDCVAARLTGQTPDPLAQDYPTAGDGVAGLEFIDAALRSSESGRWVEIG